MQGKTKDIDSRIRSVQQVCEKSNKVVFEFQQALGNTDNFDENHPSERKSTNAPKMGENGKNLNETVQN